MNDYASLSYGSSISELNYDIPSVSSPSLSKTESYNLKSSEVEEGNAHAATVYTYKVNNNKLLSNKGHIVQENSGSWSDEESENREELSYNPKILLKQSTMPLKLRMPMFAIPEADSVDEETGK